MTHFDGDTPLGQSETKDGMGIDRRDKGIKGDERLGDPEFIVRVCVKQGHTVTLARRLPVSSLRHSTSATYVWDFTRPKAVC